MEHVEIRLYSGYIRNWKSLCGELGLPADLPRRDREEAILRAAYAAWGMGLMEHLRGAFVFALWDQEQHKLFCARDQVGQKHLFYAQAGGELLVSGDLNEIARDPRFEKKLNPRMLQRYLFYGYPIGEETFYEGAFKLMPGHWLEWDGRAVTLHQYWKPVFEPDESKTLEDWTRELRAVLEEILTEEREDPQLQGKEAFLSGGVDSSYLLALSDAAAANTIGYEEPGFDESEQARETAALLGKPCRVKTISPKEFFHRIPWVMDHMGQPLGDASAVAFSLGCQGVAGRARAVYSGEGADEFFGGYNAHRNPLPQGKPYLTCSHVMNEETVRSLLKGYDETLPTAGYVVPLWETLAGQDELSRKLTMDISYWLEGDIYLNTDRTSTAAGVELHTPLSDLRLFDVARRIPARFKLRDGQNKYAFRSAAAGVLPEAIAFRKKVGFAVPIRKWLADARVNGPVREVLFGAASQRFFDQTVLTDTWTRYLAGEEFLWSRLYCIYAFLLWYTLRFGE